MDDLMCVKCADTGAIPLIVENGKVTKWQDCDECVKCPDCKDGVKADGSPCVVRISKEEAQKR